MKRPTVCAIAAMAAIAGGRRLATATRKFTTDATAREKVEAYLKDCGIADDDIAKPRGLLLE